MPSLAGRRKSLARSLAVGLAVSLGAAIVVGNGAPTVDAGPDITAAAPLATGSSQALAANCGDDGEPEDPGELACGYTISAGATLTGGVGDPADFICADSTSPDFTINCVTTGPKTLTLCCDDDGAGENEEVCDAATIYCNDAPASVNAGADAPAETGVAKAITCSATDDSLPNPPAAISYAWTSVSGPTPTFGNANLASTTATFASDGTAVLRCTASDGIRTANDTVSYTVATNVAPSVNAGADDVAGEDVPYALNATVSDDGLPSAGSLTCLWEHISGGGACVFEASGVCTPAADGCDIDVACDTVDNDYVLRLTCTDGALSANDTVTLDVQAEPENQAPVANAGADDTVEVDVAYNLVGDCDDDGLPDPPAHAACNWGESSPTGSCTIGDPTDDCTTTIECDTAEAVTVTLTCDDDELTDDDTLTLTVEEPEGCAYPYTIAGPGGEDLFCWDGTIARMRTAGYAASDAAAFAMLPAPPTLPTTTATLECDDDAELWTCSNTGGRICSVVADIPGPFILDSAADDTKWEVDPGVDIGEGGGLRFGFGGGDLDIDRFWILGGSYSGEIIHVSAGDTGHLNDFVVEGVVSAGIGGVKPGQRWLLRDIVQLNASSPIFSESPTSAAEIFTDAVLYNYSIQALNVGGEWGLRIHGSCIPNTTGDEYPDCEQTIKRVALIRFRARSYGHKPVRCGGVDGLYINTADDTYVAGQCFFANLDLPDGLSDVGSETPNVTEHALVANCGHWIGGTSGDFEFGGRAPLDECDMDEYPSCGDPDLEVEDYSKSWYADNSNRFHMAVEQDCDDNLSAKETECAGWTCPGGCSCDYGTSPRNCSTDMSVPAWPEITNAKLGALGYTDDHPADGTGTTNYIDDGDPGSITW